LSVDEANGVALDRIYSWLEASVDVHQTIGVETVLSSPKYRPLVIQARNRGFQVKLIYVVLRSAELQLERIRIRVSEGGHDVPMDKVVERRRRSFEQLAWFIRNVDECFLYDNSTAEPELLGGLRPPYLVQIRPFPSDLYDTLAQNGVEMPYLKNPASWHLL